MEPSPSPPLAQDTPSTDTVPEKSGAGRRIVDLLLRVGSWQRATWLLAGVLVAGIVLAAALSALAGEVYEAVTSGDGIALVDQPLLDWSVAHRDLMATTVATVFTHTGGPVVMPIVTSLAVLALCLLHRSRQPLVVMLPAVAGSLAMTVVGKRLIGRLRPPQEAAVPPYETSPSFPSGHSLNSVLITGVVVYFLLLWLGRRTTRVLAILLGCAYAFAMGASRVYLGHHWATDVVVAWLLGVAWLSCVVVAHQVWLAVWRRDRSRRPPSSSGG